MNNNLPDWPFPPGFFDEVEDEEVVNQREVDREKLLKLLLEHLQIYYEL